MKKTGHFCDVCGKIVDDDDVRTVTDLMFPAFAIPVQYNRENETELKIGFTVRENEKESVLTLCLDCQRKLNHFLSLIKFKFAHVVLHGYGVSIEESAQDFWAPVIPCCECGHIPAYFCRPYCENNNIIEIFCDNKCISTGDGEGIEKAIANWNARQLNWLANEVFYGRK